MRGSSSEDDGSEDDDVLASLRGDFADPFQRATARSEADRERDEADEEDERLIGDVAALFGCVLGMPDALKVVDAGVALRRASSRVRLVRDRT